MRRRLHTILFILAALILCLLPQKYVLFILPYALKRIGGFYFKKIATLWKTFSELARLTH